MTESSQITRDADRLRSIAAKCGTVQEFWKATGWTDIQAAHRANEVLNLGLPIIRKSGRDGVTKQAQPCPKSGPKTKGAKE